jgi:hypothetical protein
MEMLATWLQVPSNILYLARRTAGLGLLVASSLGTALIPGVVLPRDRIAWNAWATGYLADLSYPAVQAASADPARSGKVS